MYFSMKALVAKLGFGRAIECRTMTPSSASNSCTLLEELAEIADADMLEHADGDDAVELLAGHRPVVLQLEADAVGQGRACGTARARSSAALRSA
jgi:hypothetical protein